MLLSRKAKLQYIHQLVIHFLSQAETVTMMMFEKCFFRGAPLDEPLDDSSQVGQVSPFFPEVRRFRLEKPLPLTHAPPPSTLEEHLFQRLLQMVQRIQMHFI